MSNDSVILSARGIVKSFFQPNKVPILKGVDLTVCKGESVAITGRSGQGKSTLLNILGTLDTACEGKLEICGIPVGQFNVSKVRNRHLAFVFQSFHLMEDYTALENVLMPARIARVKVSLGSQAYYRAWELLGMVGLADRAHFNTKLLSGGEKQRIAIARALCNDPSIIFADEPSGNLDRQTSDSIHELLLSYAKNQGKALVIVTHDHELAQMCSSRYVLESGLLLNG